jgi:hypothetical protein
MLSDIRCFKINEGLAPVHVGTQRYFRRFVPDYKLLQHIRLSGFSTPSLNPILETAITESRSRSQKALRIADMNFRHHGKCFIEA